MVINSHFLNFIVTHTRKCVDWLIHIGASLYTGRFVVFRKTLSMQIFHRGENDAVYDSQYLLNSP